MFLYTHVSIRINSTYHDNSLLHKRNHWFFTRWPEFFIVRKVGRSVFRRGCCENTTLKIKPPREFNNYFHLNEFFLTTGRNRFKHLQNKFFSCKTYKLIFIFYNISKFKLVLSDVHSLFDHLDFIKKKKGFTQMLHYFLVGTLIKNVFNLLSI